MLTQITREPLFVIGARITTRLGIGVVRSHRKLKQDPRVLLYEVQLDSESCIRTWTEDELIGANPGIRQRLGMPFTARFVTGESVSTPQGEGIVRNLVRFNDVPHAIVQFVGTQRTATLPCADLSPPLQAA